MYLLDAGRISKAILSSAASLKWPAEVVFKAPTRTNKLVWACRSLHSPSMLNAKRGNQNFLFHSLWCNSTQDWSRVYQSRSGRSANFGTVQDGTTTITNTPSRNLLCAYVIFSTTLFCNTSAQDWNLWGINIQLKVLQRRPVYTFHDLFRFVRFRSCSTK